MCKFAFFTCLILVTIVLAGFAGSSLTHDMRRTLCATDALYEYLRDILVKAKVAILDLQGSVDGLLASLSTALADFRLLAALPFVSQAAGGASTACGQVGDASDAMAHAVAEITRANATVPLELSAAVAGLSQIRSLCQTLVVTARVVASVEGVLASMDSPLAQLASGPTNSSGGGVGSDPPAQSDSFGGALARVLGSVIDGMGKGRDAIDDLIAAFFEHEAFDWLGIFLLSPVALLLLLSTCGVGCLFAKHRYRRCSTEQCGVQTTGCAWVSASVLVVLYFAVAAILLPLCALGTDLTTIGIDAPLDP